LSRHHEILPAVHYSPALAHLCLRQHMRARVKQAGALSRRCKKNLREAQRYASRTPDSTSAFPRVGAAQSCALYRRQLARNLTLCCAFLNNTPLSRCIPDFPQTRRQGRRLYSALSALLRVSWYSTGPFPYEARLKAWCTPLSP